MTDRFFCDMLNRAAGLVELSHAQCFSLIGDALHLMVQDYQLEENRRKAARIEQLQLEGLQTPQDGAAVDQALFLFGPYRT